MWAGCVCEGSAACGSGEGKEEESLGGLPVTLVGSTR